MQYKKSFLFKLFFCCSIISNCLVANLVNTPIAQPNTALNKGTLNRPDYKWISSSYVGYAWSQFSGVKNPNPAQFNQASPPDSENSPLGNVPYAGFSIGRRVCRWCVLNFSYDVYGALGYRRYHAGAILPAQQAGHEILGSNYVRSFVLDHQAALFNLNLTFPKKYGIAIKRMHIVPIAAAGVGAGINKVKAFQAVGYSNLAPYGQVTTLAAPNTNINLAWTAGVGLILKPEFSAVSFGIGYRYCNGGQFVSSSEYVLNDPYNQGAVVKMAPWIGQLKTQELKLYINAEF